MKNRIVLVAAAFAAALGLAPVASASTKVAADWEMNESAGATVMHDSAGSHNGKIVQPNSQITIGKGTYTWKNRCPACLPVDKSRVIQVPDSSALEIPDASVTYSLEFRFKTTHPFGNYMQKGQSSTRGGQIKVQGPKGKVQCLFKGAKGVRVGTGSGRALDDGSWHTVRCVRTATQVQEFVDGTKVATKNGSTGPISNSSPFTVGGKLGCDQVKVTCDYYSGSMDWIKVSHG